MNPFSSLAFLVKNSLSSSQQWGWGVGGSVETCSLSGERHYSFMSDGLPRCWTSRAELRASGTHCYGNITVSVFRLGCAVQWGNACDVTSRKQTGERGICTIGGNGGIGINVSQITAHSVMSETETEEERQTQPLRELLQESLYFYWFVFVKFASSLQWDCKKKRALVTLWWSHTKPSPVVMFTRSNLQPWIFASPIFLHLKPLYVVFEDV